MTSPDAQLVAALPTGRRRALGCYLTPRPVAAFMAELLAPSLPAGGLVLDPAAGTGRLLEAVSQRIPNARPAGVELQPDLAEAANRESVAAGQPPPVCQGDGLALLDPANRRTLLGATTVDAVIANPPYVREKGNRDLFRQIREQPAWAGWLGPRQDLQQLFVLLGLELVKPGGELVYLLNPYFLTNDSGWRVRQKLAERADLLAIVEFGERRLFRGAPGQHSIVLHARRRDEAPSGRGTRVLRVDSRRGDLDAVCRELTEALASGRATPSVEVHDGGAMVVSGPRRRWHLPHASDPRLQAMERRGVPLGACFQTHQGVVSGADRVTRRNVGKLAEPVPLGTGIFVLSAAEVEGLELGEAARRELLRPLYRARQVAPFELPAEPAAWTLYLDGTLDLDRFPAVRRHLERFRGILAERRECRLGLRPWYALHWPRPASLFERPRLVTPRRAKTPRFAVGRAGYCEQSDLALITSPDDDTRRLQALAVVLNSAVMAEWSRHRGKHKGAMREFFGRALEELPLPAAVTDVPKAFLALAEYATAERHRDAEPAVRGLYGA